MPYPQNVTWNLEAFALLQQMVKEGKPFTSLDFKTRLRSTAKASVKQADVSAFLQQAHLDDHMEGFEMQDNGQYRTYAPLPKIGFFTKIFNHIKGGLELTGWTQASVKYSAKITRFGTFYNKVKRVWEDRMSETVTINGETAKDFMRDLGMESDINNVRDCSIDDIKVKPGEFRTKIKEELNRDANRRLKEIPPIKHLGFTDADVTLYGLYRVGNEIFVRRPPNEADFFKVLEKTEDGAIKTLYHGTNATNMQSIIMSGLHASKGGAFGRGLYVGPWEKALGFTSKGYHWNRKPKQYKTMLELDVIVGKCLRAEQLDKTKWQRDYDSVFYDGFKNAEYCLRDANQALIKKIILL